MKEWVLSITGGTRTIDVTVAEKTTSLQFMFPFSGTPQWISDFSTDFNHDFGF